MYMNIWEMCENILDMYRECIRNVQEYIGNIQEMLKNMKEMYRTCIRNVKEIYGKMYMNI